MKKIIIIILVSAGILTLYCYAAVSAPYTVDAYTLHLYHFDGNADDAVTSNPINLTLAYGATVTETSYTDFGTALNTYEGSSDTGSNQPIAYVDEQAISNFVGPDGAFTFEAIIRPAVEITAIPNPMQIISGENEDLASRGWQFRVDTSGQLVFIHLTTGTPISFAHAIPITGDHAWAVNEWYHAAVTYNGLENTAENLKFYWTRLDMGEGEAVLLASFQMTADLGDLPVDFAIGNDGRNAAGENFEGLVDEARISSIARAPTDMLFDGPGRPVIVSHPQDLMLPAGETAVFEAVFSSETAPQAAWYKQAPGGDQEIQPDDPNVTITLEYDPNSALYTTLLFMDNVRVANSGLYYVSVSNEQGPRTSNPAVLAVLGLVAHWPLDQAHYDGANYLDVMEETPAAVAGTPVFVTGVDGTENGAVQITPENSWATVSLFDPIRQSGQLTISFWAYWSEAPGTQQDLWAEDQSQGSSLVMENGLKADGQWRHICVVLDSQTGYFYVDGMLQDQGPWQLPPDTQAVLTLGMQGSGQDPFNGAIDELKIYNKALTVQEVAQLRYDLSGEPSCILPDARYDLTGSQGQADCAVDIYDLAELTHHFLESPSIYDLTGPDGQLDGIVNLRELAELATYWLSSGLYPAVE